MKLETQAYRHEPANQGHSVEQISAYYLELEHLLQRVNGSLTHYQVLGLDRLATNGEIRFAYLRAAALLNPSQFGLSVSIPDHSLDRVDESFEKVSRAFAMLVSFQRRTEYDESLRQRRSLETLFVQPESGPASRRVRSSQLAATKLAAASVAHDRTHDTTNDQAPKSSVPELKPPARVPGKDRRGHKRFRLSIPVQVTGYERRKGGWQEITRTIDVSQAGILLELGKRVRIGTVLHLTLPMPAELRGHRNDEPAYRIYGLVRRVEPSKKGWRAVGLDLLGEQPPEGFDTRPWALFDAKEWTGIQRRRLSRDERVEEVKIEYLSEAMELVGQETSFTENVSPKGLRVLVELIPSEFEFVRVCCPRKRFESLASVSNRYVGKDGCERLCLRLLENRWRV